MTGKLRRSEGVLIDGGTAVWSELGIASSGGVLAQNIALPNIPIKAGHSVCVSGVTGGLYARFTRVHGFLAKDK